MVVGHAHVVAFHRVGNRDRGMGHGRGATVRQPFQVGADGSLEVGVFGAAQRSRVLEQAGRGLDGEAGVGAVDIGKQARAVEGAHGRGRVDVRSKARIVLDPGARGVGRAAVPSCSFTTAQARCR